MTTTVSIPETKTATVWRVRTWEEALHLRRIRNQVKESLTRNTAHITMLRQAVWWRAYTKAQREGNAQAFIVLHDGKVIGYGLVRCEADRWWLTGAIEPEAQGNGYGRMLFSYLTRWLERTKRTPWLEVRVENFRALNLYRSLGYQTVEDRGGILVMTKP